MFDLIFSELSVSDAAEPSDATDTKPIPRRAASTRGAPRLIGGTKGGMTSKLHGVCDSKGGRLRLHLSEGQCSAFTGADVVLNDLPSAATVMGV